MSIKYQVFCSNYLILTARYLILKNLCKITKKIETKKTANSNFTKSYDEFVIDMQNDENRNKSWNYLKHINNKFTKSYTFFCKIRFVVSIIYRFKKLPLFCLKFYSNTPKTTHFYAIYFEFLVNFAIQKILIIAVICLIINTFMFVGMTGFEPATTRPPDAYSTGLSYIPLIFWTAKSAMLGITSNRFVFALTCTIFESAKIMLFFYSSNTNFFYLLILPKM